MNRVWEWTKRAAGLFHKERRDAELEEELAAHLEMLVEQNVERGMTPEEARRAAHIALGGGEQIKEAVREQRGIQLFDVLAKDAAYALRQLRHSPGFTLVILLTIALGIGVNAGIFSILDALMLRPIGDGARGTVVSVYPIFYGNIHRNTHNSLNLFSYPEFREYRDRNDVFSSFAGYVYFVNVTVSGERPTEIHGSLATCEYFDVLGVRMESGRGFIQSDCSGPGASAVVVLSDNYWRNELGADPGAVGKTIVLNRTPFQIIGIAPPGFGGTEFIRSDYWAPITMQAALIPGRAMLDSTNLSWIAALGRLKPGVSLKQARADLAVITAQADALNSGNKSRVSVQQATVFVRPQQRAAILSVGVVILVAVTFVLLIACTNIANMLLARAASRRKEIAIRAALGASRWRLIRQSLTESILFALIGGSAGTALSFVSFEALVRVAVAHLPVSDPILTPQLAPDRYILLYSLALTLFTGVVCGLAPALQSSQVDVNTALKQAGTEGAGHSLRERLLQNVLVGGQVAACMVLLLSAGLLLRGLYRAQTLEPGFEMANMDSVTFDLGSQGYKAAQADALHKRIKERLAMLPGITSLVEVRGVPLGPEHFGTAARRSGNSADIKGMGFNIVSPDFFSTFGIPIVRGRSFDEHDIQANARAIVITEAAAHTFWPDEDPVGKLLDVMGEPTPATPYVVIGVAKDAQTTDLGEPHPKILYFPTTPSEESQEQFVVHSTLSNAASLKEIRSSIHAIDPTLSFDAHSLEANLELYRAPARIAALTSATLAAMALLLAAIGVYGLVSYAVARRTREIGIRMALGADDGKVMKLVFEQVLRPVMIGIAIGVLGCAAVSRLLTSLLFGISALDPISFVFVPIFFVLVTALACWIPARRAMRVDPMVALRHE